MILIITVNIITLGKLKENYLRDGCSEYIKRLGAFCKLNIIELAPVPLPDKPSQSAISTALKKEAMLIEKKLTKGAYIFALCIEGRMATSEQFSKQINDISLSGRSTINFIIGSSYGLDPSIKCKSDMQFSMSQMTFTHQMARMMLLEQIYRAFMIGTNGKYHK